MTKEIPMEAKVVNICIYIYIYMNTSTAVIITLIHWQKVFNEHHAKTTRPIDQKIPPSIALSRQ